MQPSTHARTAIAARGLAAASIAVMAVAPITAANPVHVPPSVSADVRLAAAVPPGALLTSIARNQVLYCSIICPLVAQTGKTALATTLQTPATFLTALQGGDLLKAIGVTAASVTGPTNEAAAAAILADGSLVAPRALNAFEVAVVGALNVVPSAADGVPGIVGAIKAFRQDTFAALNAPIVENPTPTVMPNGLPQVVVVSVINVGAAVIFPAFNDVLGAVFEVPDAVAQELAATGDPVRAIDAGLTTAADARHAAVSVVKDAVHTAVVDIREASRPAARTDARRVTQTDSAATSLAKTATDRTPILHNTRATATRPIRAQSSVSHSVGNTAAEVQTAVRSMLKKNPASGPHSNSAANADSGPRHQKHMSAD